MKTRDIQIRDPFILPVKETEYYHLFGTTDKSCWGGLATGFDTYRSRDLQNWEGPFPAFRPPAGFWANTQFWAPEVHRFSRRYYMFASFKAPQRYRGTQILAANSPDEPFMPISDAPITPPDWECLDGTLYVDGDGQPWIVFCHEWVQIHNGAIYAMRLSPDLRQAAGRPIFLFNASEAKWVNRPPWPKEDEKNRFPTYVTDGPFLHRASNGALLMLWSSDGANGYAMGVALSASGNIEGPWMQEEKPLWAGDGGHGMLFRKFDGTLILTFHTPNDSPHERPVFYPVEETAAGLRLIVEK